MVVHESRVTLVYGLVCVCLLLGNLSRVLLKLWRFDTNEWMVEIQFDAHCIKVLSTVFHMRSSEYMCIKCMLCDCWDGESMCLCLIMYSNPVLLEVKSSQHFVILSIFFLLFHMCVFSFFTYKSGVARIFLQNRHILFLCV